MSLSQDLKNDSHWDHACSFYLGSGFAFSKGSYLFHNKNADTVKIGIVPHIFISRDANGLHASQGGRPAEIVGDSESIFKSATAQLDENAPCFFMVSPDIHRQYSDADIPQMLFVQPTIEFTFSPAHSRGEVTFAINAAANQQGARLLADQQLDPSQEYPTDCSDTRPLTFSAVSDDWRPVEKDEDFHNRLENAVEVLKEFPEGKLVLTRSYERRLETDSNPFDLYQIHARMNGEYAASHFVCVQDDVYSLGCTPENMYEREGAELTVDVVAATCKSSDDEKYLNDELFSSSKEVTEHMSSLTNRITRYSPFCASGSIHVTREMQVKKLRNVCHLHSVFKGELLPEVQFFDFFETMFPILSARPRELLPIADSEKGPHRFYGGAIGHQHLDSGGCFLNLRNALIKDGVIHAKVGVGVISQSTADGEFSETQDKILGLMEAVHIWQHGQIVARET